MIGLFGRGSPSAPSLFIDQLIFLVKRNKENKMAPIPPPFGREMILGIFHPYYIYTLIIILFIALIFYWLIRNGKEHETPVEILKKRYARGEIDRETFNKMKAELEG